LDDERIAKIINAAPLLYQYIEAVEAEALRRLRAEKSP
jgi:hypothetical protein